MNRYPVTGRYVNRDGTYPSPTVSLNDLCTQTELQELRKEVKQLREMVNAMWYAPGMPGANEIQEEFEKEK
jgi:hypothetical protein